MGSFFDKEEKKAKTIQREKSKWNKWSQIDLELDIELKYIEKNGKFQVFREINNKIGIWDGKNMIEIETDFSYSNNWICSINYFNFVFENDRKYFYTKKEDFIEMLKKFFDMQN